MADHGCNMEPHSLERTSDDNFDSNMMKAAGLAPPQNFEPQRTWVSLCACFGACRLPLRSTLDNDPQAYATKQELLAPLMVLYRWAHHCLPGCEHHEICWQQHQ